MTVNFLTPVPSFQNYRSNNLNNPRTNLTGGLIKWWSPEQHQTPLKNSLNSMSINWISYVTKPYISTTIEDIVSVKINNNIPNKTLEVPTPIEDIDYFKIYNIFPEDTLKKIISYIKSHSEGGHTTYLFDIPDKTSMKFSSTHELENPSCLKLKSSEIQKWHTIALNRFAKELKLVGDYNNIGIYFIRRNIKVMENIDSYQDFHYDGDKKGACSMLMVVHNDYEYVDGPNSGLDIAYNMIESPLYSNHVLVEKYIPVEYPVNGAIFVPGGQTKVVHRGSHFKPSDQDAVPCKHPSRTIIVVSIDKKDNENIIW